MAILFEARSELKIGKIIEVNGNALRIELDSQLTELTRSIDGRVYPIGQMGSIIKVHFGRKILFAYVRMLRMLSDVLAEEGKSIITSSDDTRIIEADLFGEGFWKFTLEKLIFSRGIETYPLPLQGVYLCLNEELESIYQAAEATAEEVAVNPLVPIGNYFGGNNAVCRANVDKLFGHHCAILGSTGAGKSATVASVLHAIFQHKFDDKKLRPRMIIIDPHGEYSSSFKDNAVVYRAYEEASINEQNSKQLCLPYWLMSSDEFRSLVIGKTEYEATSQNNIVYQAISYSRMLEAGLLEELGNTPVGGFQAKPVSGVDENTLLNFDRDKPIPFKLGEFVKHVDKVQGQKLNKQEPLAQSPGRDKIDSILQKLKVLRVNPQLGFIMNEYTDTLRPPFIIGLK